MGSEYSNLGIYILLKSGTSYPVGVTPAPLGEGANKGVLKGGQGWFKNCFLSVQQIRDIVHAEDVGKLELKTAEEMRTIISIDRIIDEKPIIIEP